MILMTYIQEKKKKNRCSDLSVVKFFAANSDRKVIIKIFNITELFKSPSYHFMLPSLSQPRRS